MTPTPAGTIETTKTVFDLDRKEDVTLVKQGTFSPVTSVQEFVTRLENNSDAILAVINDGLKSHEMARLAESENPWMEKNEKDELIPYAGTPISPIAAKSLNTMVLQFAKLLFGYDEADKISDVEKKRAAKREAKEKALAMQLSNAVVVEALKKLA